LNLVRVPSCEWRNSHIEVDQKVTSRLGGQRFGAFKGLMSRRRVYTTELTLADPSGSSLNRRSRCRAEFNITLGANSVVSFRYDTLGRRQQRAVQPGFNVDASVQFEFLKSVTYRKVPPKRDGTGGPGDGAQPALYYVHNANVAVSRFLAGMLEVTIDFRLVASTYYSPGQGSGHFYVRPDFTRLEPGNFGHPHRQAFASPLGYPASASRRSRLDRRFFGTTPDIYR